MQGSILAIYPLCFCIIMVVLIWGIQKSPNEFAVLCILFCVMQISGLRVMFLHFEVVVQVDINFQSPYLQTVSPELLNCTTEQNFIFILDL